MKIIKRILSVVLAVAITLQCGNTAFAEAASPRQEYSDDGVLYTYNADGTVTATIYTSPVVEERKTTSNEDDRLEDHGDSYVNTSENVTVTLEKTYSDGDILVSLSDADTAIAFYPETAAGAVPVEPSGPVEAETNEDLDSLSYEGLPAEDDLGELAELPDEKQSAGEDKSTEVTGTDQQEEIEQQPATEVQTPDSPDEKDDANELSAVSRKHSIHLSPLSVRRSAAISTHYLASSTDSSELNEEDTPDETPNPVETPTPTAIPEPTEPLVQTATPVSAETPEPTETPAPAESPAPTNTPTPAENLPERQEQTAPDTPKVEVVSPNCVKVLEPQAGLEYSINNGLTWVAIDNNGEVRFENLAPETEYEVVARKMGIDTFLPSPPSAPAKVTTPAETPEATPEPTEAPLPTPEPTSTPEPTPTPTPLPSETPAATTEQQQQYEPAAVYDSVNGVGMGYANGTYAGVLYPGAINEFTDIEFIPKGNGVKETVIMRQYTTPEMSYVLDFSGLSPVLSGNSVLLYDASGVKSGEISAPYLLDANGAYNDNIVVSLENIGGGYRLTYKLDGAWLQNAAFPVILDPSTYIGKDDDGHSWNNMEDAYVTSAEPNRNYGWTNWQLQCGNTSGEALCLFRPVFPDSINNIADYILVKEVKLHTYVESVSGGNTYRVYQLLGDWNSQTVTYNNCPAYTASNSAPKYIASSGWYEWDLTAAASTWFNSLAQMQAYGVLIRGESSGGYLTFASSDPWINNAYYTITYYPVAQSNPKDPNLRVTAYGNALNSGTGYLNLDWGTVEGASNYYVGIHNGKAYEYFYVNGATSWTTQGKGIWPTEDEINSGRYLLHHDGAGAELPTIPAFSYNNSGGALAGNLNYSICVVPANQYGQAPNPKYFGVRTARLPDRLPPSVPESMDLENGIYTNADEVTLLWTGMRDYNDTATSAVASLGTGCVQISVDSTGDWVDTDCSSGDGSTMLDISALDEGYHVVYVRGKDSAGNTGTAAPLQFCIDRTPPSAPEIAVVPSEWSNEASISLTWSGITDINELNRVEYAIDGAEYVSTGLNTAEYSGFIIDVSSLDDGEHTLSVRGVDLAGNEGEAAAAVFRRDTTAPVFDDASVDPDSWTNKNEISFGWTALEDIHSGLKLVWYSVDDGEQLSLETKKDLSTPLDISDLADGEHTILLHFEDNVGNTREETLSLFRDVTKPELAILSPTDGSAVNGTVEVLGSVDDLSLDTWKLTATGEDGTAHLLKSGTDKKDAELLGILNCALFADGEKVELKLYAIDKAGNENEVSGTVIVVDKSAKPISGTVTITSPESNEQLKTPSMIGTYTTEYEQSETEGLLYIDGVYQGKTKNKTFPFDTITYEENSVHSISVLSRANDGTIQFSQGVSNYVLHSDAFEDDSFLSSHSGIAFDYSASLDGAASGTLISQMITPAFPVLSLRISVTENKPAGTDIQYYYSTDSGETWTSISPEMDVPMLSRPETVMIKAELTGDGANSPILYGLTVQGVIETNPTRVIVKLLRSVEQIELASTTVTKAITTLAETPENAVDLGQYVDGQLKADTFTFDARPITEKGSRKVVLTAHTDADVFHGTKAAASVLLRENVSESGTVESEELKADGKLYAIRLEALYDGAMAFRYSTDKETWYKLTPGAYVYLESPADSVYLRAAGGTLRAWHLEGVTCSESRITVQIMQPLSNVTAADWGEEAYKNEKLRYCDLSWTDATPEDTTAAYTTQYEIYRNGELIATTTDTRYRDNYYLAGARYEVRAVRTYSGYEPHTSDRTAATRIVMKAPAYETEVKPELPEQKQSEYLNKLYGGNYTFSGEAKAPVDDRALDMSLLGRNKLCANGFEPINFNTGNFLLETVDYSLSDLGLAVLTLDRTYNSRSDAPNGPFGAKWSSTWTEHLRLYTEGDITYTQADGAEIVFTRRANGSYTGGEGRGLTLTANGSEYRITNLDGEIHAFTGGGLLKYVQFSDGNRITLRRDEDGLITALVLPSGKTLAVESDRSGHITSIETAAGTLRYTYRGNLLERFTDADGSEIRYAYDAQGRMTEWYDASGVRQVRNTYDQKGRVTHQIDAGGGEYAVEYFDDHTVTTDADGNRSEIWFDAQKRTTKTVDANGGEISYTYNQHSNIIAITDALGNTTRYEYDAFGNKVKETAPDGSSYSLQYDASNNLTQLTDQRGGVTRYEYDTHNRLVKQTNSDGGVIAYTYNDAGQVLTVTDPLGHVTAYEYDGVDLVRSTDPNGNVTSYTYDGQHRLTATTDALGNTTAFAYDGQDNLTSVTFADGTSFAYEYDKVGNLTAQTDALGNVTRYEYDALRQLVKTIYPDGSESTSTYDHSGNLIAAIDALGSEATAAYDGRGRISTLTDALGNTTTYTYDLNGNLLSETLANGAETQYHYTPNSQLSSVTNAAGEQIFYTYDAAGNLLSVTAPDGGVTRYGYDAMGRLLSETDPNGATTTYAYDKAGRLASKTDALGNTTTYTFDANGNLLTITDALGGVTSYTYDALNRAVSMTDANGATTTYTYDAVGNLVSQTDALGAVTTYAYDDNGSITGLTDALGGKSAMSYDELGNVIVVLQKNSGTVNAAYDPLGHLLSETDALGNTTAYEYDANGKVTRITDALGQSAEIAYDETGNVTRVGAPDGSETSYAYDLAGRLLSETSATGAKTGYTYESGRLTSTAVNGNETRFTYDLAGNITSVTDAEGRKVELSYDALGNLTAVTYPDGTQDSYEYDALSRLVKYTPREGDATAYTYNAMGDVLTVTVGNQTTSYEYDLLGRMTATITADGARTEAVYDALGNTVKTTDALGNATSYAYTVDSLLKEIRYANGATLTANYDLVGNLTAETDPEGNATAYEYDPVGRMTAVTDALGNTTRYEYDAADNLAKVTDALGHVTSYTYDALGNLTSETDALGNTVKYSYTTEGWLETVTDAEGHVTRYTYDRTGNVLTADYAGEQTETNTYNELGLLTTVTTAEGDTLYQYDDASRLISVTQPNGETVSYTYDSHGNRATMTYPNGKTVKYTYDDMNRLIAVKGIDGATTKYSYDALGRRIATDGVKEDTVYAYDEVGNLVSQTTTGAYDLALEYAYDLSGRMTQESRTENGATLESVFTYDPLGQLTSFTRSDGQSETYTYDPVGNMTAKTQNGVSTAMRYNAANQLISSVSGTDKTTYTYDANGNLVRSENAGGARSYAYNALNLLESFTREDGYTENYSYNANRLLSEIRTNEDLTTTLTWDILYGDGVVISAAQNGQKTSYTYGLERISAKTGSTRTEYVYDGRGSVAAEVSYNNAWYTFGGGLARKNVVSKSYSPFGELLTEQTSGFGYNGEYYNAATGMIYLRARFYEPEMNRFGQKDTLRGSIADGISLNRYLYCWNDPIDYIDPSGQLGILGAAGLIGAIAGGVTGAVSAVLDAHKTGQKVTVRNVLKGTAIGVASGMTAGVTAAATFASTGSVKIAATAAGMAGGAVAGGLSSAINSIESGQSVGTVLKNTALGAAHGAVRGGVTAMIGTSLGGSTAAYVGANALTGIADRYITSRVSGNGIRESAKSAYDLKEIASDLILGMTAAVAAKGAQRAVTAIGSAIEGSKASRESTNNTSRTSKNVSNNSDSITDELTSEETQNGTTRDINQPVPQPKNGGSARIPTVESTQAGGQSVGCSRSESSTRAIYRAVGVDEYYDIMNTGRFRGADGSLAAKEFGNSFEETLDFANRSINTDKVAIIKVTIPEDVYIRLNHMTLDAPIFKSGTPVVEPNMLDYFNENIISIEHVY